MFPFDNVIMLLKDNILICMFSKQNLSILIFVITVPKVPINNKTTSAKGLWANTWATDDLVHRRDMPSRGQLELLGMKYVLLAQNVYLIR